MHFHRTFGTSPLYLTPGFWLAYGIVDVISDLLSLAGFLHVTPVRQSEHKLIVLLVPLPL